VRGIIRNDLLWEYTIEADSSEVLPPDTLSDLKQQIGTSGGGGTVGAIVAASPSLSGLVVALGGSDYAAVPMDGSPAYAPVWNSQPFFPRTAFTGLVRVWAWTRNAGGTVTARLRNVTDSTTAGSTSAVTATARPSTPETFSVAILADKEYRLEVVGSAADEDVFGLGQLEAA